MGYSLTGFPTKVPQRYLRKQVNSRYVESHKNSDWFVQLAYVMNNNLENDPENDPKNGVQSKMFLKFYIFIRDFMPQGLTGNLSHIKGQDVMNHLLCHAEYTPSRHKISKSADIAFANLEKWIGNSPNWNLSQQQAKTKAPGLHSPAGLLALLIIAHPDPDLRFKNWIRRLQINWMMQPRHLLDVKNGFWKGLNARNVYEVSLCFQFPEC